MNGYIILLLMAICLLGGFASGWHEKTLRYEAAQEKAAIVQADNAAATQVKIITKTQTLTRIIHESSDTCLTKPVAPDLLQQLK